MGKKWMIYKAEVPLPTFSKDNFMNQFRRNGPGLSTLYISFVNHCYWELIPLETRFQTVHKQISGPLANKYSDICINYFRFPPVFQRNERKGGYKRSSKKIGFNRKRKTLRSLWNIWLCRIQEEYHLAQKLP